MTAISRQEALDLLLSRANRIAGAETVPADLALGRVLAIPLVSPLDVPPCDNSAMDGYAVPLGASEFPVSQRIAAGMVPSALARDTAARIFTGAPIPEGAAAVVMQEDCEFGDGMVRLKKLPSAGENIRRRGEDIGKGGIFLGAGKRLRPQELGLIASVGLSTVTVWRRLRVSIFFTGDEIVMPGHPLAGGKIYNSNRSSLLGLLEALGCEVSDHGIVADNPQATREALERAASGSDLVLTCGGVSVGEEDHVRAAVEALGSIELWKVNIKPGKPFAFGEVRGIPFLGLPGNPVSAFVIFCLFARPFILRMQGAERLLPMAFMVESGFDWKASPREEWLRASIDPEGRAQCHPGQGSGVLTSLSRSDGLVEIPAGAGMRRGAAVKFIPFPEFLA